MVALLIKDAQPAGRVRLHCHRLCPARRKAAKTQWRRVADQLRSKLPKLASSFHGGDSRLSSATINKLLGSVQAVGRWARDNGIILDNVQWSDPFANMRLDEDEPNREP